MKKTETAFLYREIYRDIKRKIIDGTYQQGEIIEPENRLKEIYHVSRDTVRRAMNLLKRERLVTRKASIGTMVAFRKMDYEPSGCHESFSERMYRLGYTPSSEVLSIEILKEIDPHIAAVMHFKMGEKMYRISRIRKANGSPMAYEITYVFEKYCPDIQTMITDHTSLYDLYENHYHLQMGHINLKLEAETGNARMLRLLQMHNSTAILKISSVMFLAKGEPLYYVISYHVGNRYTYTTTLPRRIG